MDAIKTFLNIPNFKLLPSLMCIFLFLCLCLLSSCDGNSETEKKVDRVASQIGNQIVDQTNRLGELIPSKDEIKKSSNEQIEKTFAIEYRVVDIKADSSAEQTQTLLNDLGKERWDCFSITSEKEGSRLLCKRRPLSALRALIGAGGLLMW